MTNAPLISILLPTYNRPGQFAEALASIARQDASLIGEVLVGDDSGERLRAANQAVIADSPIAPLVRYLPNDPPKGNYPNQWSLGAQARCPYLLILHDDDHLCADALDRLATACARETDERVKLWFGRNLIMDEQGQVDMSHTRRNDAHFGKDGPSASRPLWEWCLTESVPPNAFLVATETYTRFKQGPLDGNVGDWGFVVRSSNSGVWARFVPHYLSSYRVQADSVTNAGRGMDVHRWYQLARQLVVPRDAQHQKKQRLAGTAMVATVRFAREGERRNAWRCFLSSDCTWRERLSARGGATLLMLLTPRSIWRWALRYRA